MVPAQFSGNQTTVGAPQMPINENEMGAESSRSLQDQAPAVFFLNRVAPGGFQNLSPEIRQVALVIN